MNCSTVLGLGGISDVTTLGEQYQVFTVKVALLGLEKSVLGERQRHTSFQFVFDQQHCVGGLRGTRNRACWQRPAAEVAVVEVGRVSDDTAKT